ncbi:MAG: sigma-70 family RNA polymerase sigma factor [Ignavibacteriae bacterium]|nr:sigma-70 family RNA polymerase sigma factor [Ignavibacteriota bacterium]MCB9216755.1 sigma-70 family RNA polymerase sigma factor [Ignavibacteria bacterium]
MRLYEPLRPRLARFAAAMTNDREDARDLVAETTLAAYEQFNTLRDERAFLSWLFTIASRLYRKRGIREKYHGEYHEEQVRRMPDSGTSPEASADVALLYAALEKLPSEQREAVTLFEIADIPLKEISAIQGTTLSSVKSRVTRGRRKLAELLGAVDEGMEEAASPEASVEESPKNLLYMNAA